MVDLCKTYVVLSELHVSAYAGNVDYTRLVAGAVLAPFRKEAEERRRDKEYGGRVDRVNRPPLFERLIIEQSAAECLRRLVLRRREVVEERRNGSHLSGAVACGLACSAAERASYALVHEDVQLAFSCLNLLLSVGDAFAICYVHLQSRINPVSFQRQLASSAWNTYGMISPFPSPLPNEATEASRTPLRRPVMYTGNRVRQRA